MENNTNILDKLKILTPRPFSNYSFDKLSLNNDSINQSNVSEFLDYLCNGNYYIEDKEVFKKLITDKQFKNRFNFNELFAKLLNYSPSNNLLKEELINFFLSNKYISKQIIVDNNFRMFCSISKDIKLLKKLIKKIKNFSVIQSGFDGALSCSNEVFLKTFWKNKEYREKLNFINDSLTLMILQFPYENHILLKLNKICDTTPYIQSSFDKVPNLLVDCWSYDLSDMSYINHLILNKKLILTENMENELSKDEDDKKIVLFFNKYNLNLKLHDNLIINRPSKKLKL